MTLEQFQELGASRTHPRRLSTLAELANLTVFMASDKASGMTGTTSTCPWGAWTTSGFRPLSGGWTP
jgi:hypothetical protein